MRATPLKYQGKFLGPASSVTLYFYSSSQFVPFLFRATVSSVIFLTRFNFSCMSSSSLSLSFSLSFLLLRTCRFYLFFTIIREVSNSERSRHSLLSSVRDICSFFDSPYFSCRARNVFFFSFLFPFFFFFTDVESLPTALMNLNCLSAVGEITSL